MKTYTVINQNDGNDDFEIEADNLLDAALDACMELGWSISDDSKDYELMKAAPDLLSALQEMMSVFQDHEQYDEESAEVVSIARAAIAKAEGRAE